MGKEWILNQANMRWQLNRPKHVGKVAEEIRKCAPRCVAEWEDYYYSKVFSREHLEEVGRRLFVKVREVCRAEIGAITEQGCVEFVKGLVIRRTFDGYVSEKQTISEQLQAELGVTVQPAPDEWDRGYNVDFYIEVEGSYIGLQVKPAGYPYIPQIINEMQFQSATHEAFRSRFGGRVFYVISVADGKKKTIENVDVIDEIRAEIKRLQAQGGDEGKRLNDT